MKPGLSIAILFFMASCAPTAMSVLVSGEYNEKKDSTSYVVFPIGSVWLPGKWTKTGYNTVSHQQWFLNKDSISVGIAFERCDRYEFSQKPMKDFEFVKAFYEWDSKYLVERDRLSREIVEQDSTSRYIIWRIWNDKADSYFLYGSRNCSVHNYNVSTGKWTKERKVEFLRRLYLPGK